MTPQFVDFNADGHVDILAATFDGSPHVAFGSQDGFLEPQHVLTSPDGERVLLSKFWNYESKEWDETDDTPGGHCTSALAFDWDGDGDFDLLMGDYKEGTLLRRMNEGTAKQPSFPGPNIAVEADGKALVLEGGLASPHLVDWDGDGLTDLLCGGYGDAYGDGPGAGIHWYRNTGKPGAPIFAAPETLIEPSRKDSRTPVRPDSGLYLETVDWNGDGRLDILVGGYSNWRPPARDLTPEEELRVKELEAEIEEGNRAMGVMFGEVGADLSEEERTAAWEELVESEEFTTLQRALKEKREELDDLRQSMKRETFVWLYRRT